MKRALNPHREVQKTVPPLSNHQSFNFFVLSLQDDPVPAREPKKSSATASGAGHEGEGREGRKVRTVVPGEDGGAHGGSPALSRRASDIRPGAGGGKHFKKFHSEQNIFFIKSYKKNLKANKKSFMS